MLTLVPEAIEAYAVRHTTPISALKDRLRAETQADVASPQMMVGPLEGRLLTLLARLSGARRAVEIGTFTGYSGLSIAEGLAEGGTLITCDIDPRAQGIARRYFDESPWAAQIDTRLGAALETLNGIEGPLDLVFIDADKTSYQAYWDAVLPKMRPGGMVLVDNVLWSGRVVSPEDETTRAIVAFNTAVASDDRVEQVMLTVRDGLTLSVVK